MKIPGSFLAWNYSRQQRSLSKNPPTHPCLAIVEDERVIACSCVDYAIVLNWSLIMTKAHIVMIIFVTSIVMIYRIELLNVINCISLHNYQQQDREIMRRYQ